MRTSSTTQPQAVPGDRPTPASPLRAVLGAIEEGTPTLRAVRERTGLDAGLIDAAVDHLIRTGRVGVSTLAPGCATGCGGCPMAGGGCGPRGAATLLLWARADRGETA